MSRIIDNLKVELDEDLQEKLEWLMPQHGPYRILKQSIDARRSRSPHFVYSVEVAESGETLKTNSHPLTPVAAKGAKPIIIGSGPAGLFAALRLVERGIPCHLFERGSVAEKRMKSINHFWRYGQFDPENNVCFGEGGAGLYSDGKLITRIKSPHIPYVLNRLVQFGAPEEIQYLANPHVGSDRIRRVIPKLRDFLSGQGCELHYDIRVDEILFKNQKVSGVKTHSGEIFLSSHVILAVGHSAEDTFEHLREQNVFMEAKAYAIGLRIEHPQKQINRIQFREYADHPKLGSANYRLAHHDHKSQIGVYSFCMCPGGYVLSSGSHADGIVTNGMSNYLRNSPFANSALVVSVPASPTLWGGLELRRALETKSRQLSELTASGRELPAQTLYDFLEEKSGKLLPTSSPSGATKARLDLLLPPDLKKKLVEGLTAFDTQMKGFISESAQLYGIESRTSCPLRITRHEETLESLSHSGLYPCGEGAGYAGGITSAACDGVKVAEKIVEVISR